MESSEKIFNDYSIDRTEDGKVILRNGTDDYDFSLPKDMLLVDACITRVEPYEYEDDNPNGDLTKYIQYFNINKVESQLVIPVNELDEQNPIKTGDLKCDVDYLFLKFKDLDGNIMPVYVDIKDLV